MASRKILLVDDSETVLQMEQMILAKSSYELILARNGEEGVAKALTTQPDLILMDVVMPKMNGFEAVKQLRENAQTRSVPIVMVTSKAEAESMETGYQTGCSDYIIKPDVIITRDTEEDATINAHGALVDEQYARLASLRKINGGRPILHASISCKWTIRSDRVQAARTEALNLIRNRKGRLPHVVVVTGEPWPNRLAAIALGTGDIDCVYHFSLSELKEK